MNYCTHGFADNGEGCPAARCEVRDEYDRPEASLLRAEARVAELKARVDFLEFTICRHVLAREGESGERPDITVSALYRIEREVRERATDSVSTEKETNDG